MFAPMVVNLLGFKINVAERNSIISLGPVFQIDVFQSNKRNQGFGEQNGDLSPNWFPVQAVNNPVVQDSASAKLSAV
ncbi:hypothetical protein Tfer_1408 [Thermincola ferriacetica]|uniref:Uncharacterized protein n=1 Tax=Thermincola ferriacetica TaxID=281456 RepID=A0A0L6W322_9FIRM|nr:hypothetical protein [Thermincola ferriacetica]KNZ69798.1 hypothetical protein Tfer_1408 [Thermincola ferriacetica]